MNYDIRCEMKNIVDNLSFDLYSIDYELRTNCYYDKDLYLKLTKSVLYYKTSSRNLASAYRFGVVYFNKKLKEMELYYYNNYYDEMIFVNRENNNYYHKMCRLKNFIKNELFVEDSVLFLTLTFTDNVLFRSSSESRRTYVRKFLKSYNTSAVANIDFGDQKGREHYHALIAVDKVNHLDWVSGSVNFKHVGFAERDLNCTSHYLTKLTRHALKDSTHFKNLIYIHKNRKR